MLGEADAATKDIFRTSVPVMDETLRLGSSSEAWNQILQGPDHTEVIIRENSLEEKVLQVRPGGRGGVLQVADRNAGEKLEEETSKPFESLEMSIWRTMISVSWGFFKPCADSKV